MKVYEGTACGKIYIAGEYAVVLNRPAIIAPIKKYIKVKLDKCDNYYLKSHKYHNNYIKLDLDNFDNNTVFITKTIKWFNRYLDELGINKHFFQIEIISELDSNDQKFGFGSSGAVTIALLRALFGFYNLEYNKITLYKAGVMIQSQISKYSSYGDLACIAFEEIIFYKKVDNDFLNQFNTKSIIELLEMEWTGLVIEKIKDDFEFLIVYTNKNANSFRLVEEVISCQNNEDFLKFLNRSEELVLEFKKNYNKIDIISQLNINLQLLNKITSGLLITEEMMKIEKIIDDFNGVMKFSGAGGGDSVICFFNNKQDLNCSSKKLNKLNYFYFIYPIEEEINE